MERKVHIKTVLASAAAALCLLSATPSTPAAFKNVTLGAKPPVISAKTLDGGESTSDEFFGKKVTVVLFWATWSPRSLEVLGDLEALGTSLGTDRFQVLAVNAEHQQISRSDEDLIRQALAESGSTAHVLLDDGLKAYNDYGTMALPSMVVVDGEGKVAFTMAGYPTTMRSDLGQAVKLALGIITEEETAAVEIYKPKNHALMYYNMGKRLYDKGQEEKAEGQLLEAVGRDPEFVKPHLLLGIYYKKTGRHDEALGEFEKVKSLDPRNNEAGYQAAAISLQTKNFKEAERLFAELNTEYPEKEEFALGLALARKYQGREEEYRSLKESSKDLFPAEARYYYELGGAAELADDLEVAAEFYRIALHKAFQTSRR